MKNVLRFGIVLAMTTITVVVLQALLVAHAIRMVVKQS